MAKIKFISKTKLETVDETTEEKIAKALEQATDFNDFKTRLSTAFKKPQGGLRS